MNELNGQQGLLVLEKSPTGISGLDEITGGGLPRGRPTLVCGNAGSGKTLFAMEFLVRGATCFHEPGVFIAFEETENELAANVASIGWDLNALAEAQKIYLDHVHIEKSEIQETGDFNLDGLFIRIESAIRAVNAKRIAVDTIEALFAGFSDEGLLRAEIRRLFRWMKDKGLTAVITGEKGDSNFTRHGLEEYISDCVIFLDHRLQKQVATRRIQVIKYRGTVHGTNEYPFLITEKGFSVFPITALDMDYPVSSERIPTGIERLNAMLGGEGYFRGSSILVSGTAGTGKSSLGACFVASACRRGERALYFSFEEAPRQIIRNMASIGIELERPVNDGLLKFKAVRATSFGLEIHLSKMVQLIKDFQPEVVVMDPISNLSSVADDKAVKEMLTRLIDYMKMQGVTALFTDLTHAGNAKEATEVAISSLMDTWILLRDIEHNGERNRGMYVLKSRGMEHSNQIREFIISSRGLELIDVYVGTDGLLTGTARVARESRDAADAEAHRQRIGKLRRDLERKENAMQNRIQELRDAFVSESEQIEHAIAEAEASKAVLARNREKIARMKGRE